METDFAFSSGRSGGEYVVYIYSGWDDGSDVDYEYIDDLPAGFSLSQNYPNPFNPTTTIEFSLPEQSHTELTIYNVLGQQITELIDAALSPGSYRVCWDGTDKSGRVVPSGVYLYRLTTDSFTASRKMLLLK